MSDPNYIRESRKQQAQHLEPRHITGRVIIPINDDGKQVEYSAATKFRTINGQRPGDIVKSREGKRYIIRTDGSARRIKV